jgi:hypothetical protein
MTANARSLLLCSLAGATLLGGCDNAHEAVDLGSWRPAPASAAPEPANPPRHDTEIAITPLGEGAGALVARGDLVHLRFTRTTTWSDGTEHANGTYEAWIWTGWEPEAGLDYWGNFGSPELRNALVGRAVGERFQLRVVTDYAEIKAPRYGVATPQSPRTGLNEVVSNPAQTTPVVLAGGKFAWNQPSRSDVEIVASCPATLSTRTGQVEQWGHHFNMFGSAYQTDRSGIIRWARLDAQCPQPEGTVRIVLGPIYWRSEPWADHALMGWQDTYLGQVPLTSHPQDYNFVSIGGRQPDADTR